jgi:hypothetical protein
MDELMNKAQTVRSIKDGIIIGTTMAVVFVALALTLTLAMGNTQATQVKYSRATACELAIPVTSHGRDPALVSECFVQQGLPAPDFVGRS